jgi:Uma2 family endonuclease
MPPVATTQRMNAEEFFEWCNRPENRDRHFELERGEVVEVSRPGERHGFVCLNVGRLLGNDTGVLLERDPDTVRGPDVVLYDQARRYEELSAGYCEQPPTLAVAVLSPNYRWGKVSQRITQFLAQGVAVVWVVDPEGQSLTVSRANQLPQVFEGDDELTGEPEMPGFRCRVAGVFYLPGEETPTNEAGQG